MKDAVNKMLEVDSSEFVKERITNLEKAINSNNFCNIMDAFRDYFKLEETIESNGYHQQIISARKRIHEIFGYHSFNKARFE